MSDVITVFRKEVKDVVFQGGRTALLRPAILVVLFGIVLPLQLKEDWVTLPAAILFAEIWAPVFVALTIVADAFAGERERHTLESLLATPLSDGALLIGKMAVPTCYAMLILVIDLLVGIVVADVAAQGTAAFYPVGVFLGTLFIGLALNVLAAAVGVLVSLRCSTVRQALQILTIGSMALLLGGISSSAILASHVHATISEVATLWIIGAVLAVLAAGAVAADFTFFRRDRLILA